MTAFILLVCTLVALPVGKRVARVVHLVKDPQTRSEYVVRKTIGRTSL